MEETGGGGKERVCPEEAQMSRKAKVVPGLVSISAM